MNRPVRIGGHALEAKRIAEAVRREPAKFSSDHFRIAARIMFWAEREPKVLRHDAEIQGALEGMHDLAVEAGLI